MTSARWGERGRGVSVIGMVDVLASLPHRKLVGGAAVLVGVIAVGDYATGAELSFSAFYLIPVFMSAVAGSVAGAAVAFVATATWSVIDVVTRTVPFEQPIAPAWNLTIRFVVLAMVAALVAALEDRLSVERTLSRTDSLTHLANARAFHHATHRELLRMTRSGHPLTVAYIDVDDFKSINDAHGHRAGDDFLVRAAAAMTDDLRATDLVARLGGDEFAILLPETDVDEALSLLSRLHATLQATTAQWTSGFSIGAVTFAVPPRSADEAISAADHVMYDVKRDGKCSVRCLPASQVAHRVDERWQRENQDTDGAVR